MKSFHMWIKKYNEKDNLAEKRDLNEGKMSKSMEEQKK